MVGLGSNPDSLLLGPRPLNHDLNSSKLTTDISEGQRRCVSNQLGGVYCGLAYVVHLLRAVCHAMREDSSELIVQMKAGFMDSWLMTFNCTPFFVLRVLH